MADFDNAVNGVEANLEWLKRCIQDQEVRYQECHRLAASLASALDSYEVARRNTSDKADHRKWWESVQKAKDAYRAAEAGNFYSTPPQVEER